MQISDSKTPAEFFKEENSIEWCSSDAVFIVYGEKFFYPESSQPGHFVAKYDPIVGFTTLENTLIHKVTAIIQTAYTLKP